MHPQDPQPPIHITLGARLYTTGDLFLGALALLVLDAIVGWIVWSAFSSAVYLIAAIFTIIGIALAILGLTIKRRAKADGKRRHQARLLLESTDHHAEDDQLADIISAWLIHRNATRDDPKILHTHDAEQLEARLARPIPRLWIINEAHALPQRNHTTLPAGQPTTPRRAIFTSRARTIPPQPLPADHFACRPTRHGQQITKASREGDLSAVIIASILLTFFGFAFITNIPLIGIALFFLAGAIGVVGIAATYSDAPPRHWAIATANNQGWIVRIQRARITEAYPIDDRALIITYPARHPGTSAPARTHRTRVIMPPALGIPITVFEADGVDLATIANPLNIDPHAPAPPPPPPPTPPPSGRAPGR
ncbi:MAG: hypothetical protein ACTS3F_04510, partial [Phycisphaerales bacterium]